jgi:hypothetical protein
MVIDLDGTVSDTVVKEIEAVEGIIKVRVIK